MSNTNKESTRHTVYLGYKEAGRDLLARIQSADDNVNRFIVSAIIEKLARTKPKQSPK